MNFSACETLEKRAEVGTWFRAIPPQYWATSLLTSQTKDIPSRYSGGRKSERPFEMLYLCENGTIALEEVGAQFRHPTSGRIFSDPSRPWLIMNVLVRLQSVADITRLDAQRLLDTNAQELTGDWRAYSYRHTHSSVSEPTGLAPTQELGQALFDTATIEGFFVVSAKLPDHRNLIIFPEKLRAGSELRFINPISNQVHVVTGLLP